MAGFDIDVCDAIAQDAGLTYTLLAMDFNGIIPALQTGQVQAAIAFPKGSDLRERVDASLAKIKADGSYAAIYRKWFDADPPAN